MLGLEVCIMPGLCGTGNQIQTSFHANQALGQLMSISSQPHFLKWVYNPIFPVSFFGLSYSVHRKMEEPGWELMPSQTDGCLLLEKYPSDNRDLTKCYFVSFIWLCYTQQVISSLSLQATYKIRVKLLYCQESCDIIWQGFISWKHYPNVRSLTEILSKLKIKVCLY